MWDPHADFKHTVLSNGLSVYVCQWPRPWEVVRFVIHSGAREDLVGLEGTAHFVEHLVSLNAGVSEKEIIAFFQNPGGRAWLGSTCSLDTNYGFFAPIGNVLEALDIFGQMLIGAKLENWVEHERGVIANEFYRRFPYSYSRSNEARRNNALYSGQWKGRYFTNLGLPDSLKRIRQTNLQLFYDKHYVPANISVVAVGGMSLDEVVKALSKSLFVKNKPGNRNPILEPTSFTDFPLETRQVFEIEKEIGVSSDIGSYVSFAQIPGVYNSAALRVLDKTLNTALEKELRNERGLLYRSGCSWTHYQQFYELQIFGDSVPADMLDQTEEIVEDCLSSLGSQQELFETSKQRVVSSYTMSDLSADDLCSEAISRLSIFHRIVTDQEDMEAAKRVTIDDIRSLLTWLVPERRFTRISKP